MFVSTRSSRLKEDSGETCQTVVFQNKKREGIISHVKKNETNKEEGRVRREKRNEGKELDLRKLRYDIIKFGTSGFSGSKKEDSRVALAIALGAKPPKRKATNYKKILEEKKAEKEQQAQASEQNMAKIIFKKGELKRKFKNKNETTGLLNEYGKIRTKR